MGKATTWIHVYDAALQWLLRGSGCRRGRREIREHIGPDGLEIHQASLGYPFLAPVRNGRHCDFANLGNFGCPAKFVNYLVCCLHLAIVRETERKVNSQTE